MIPFERYRDSFGAPGVALDRLGEALARDPEADDIVLHATIQRFEFTSELFWKTLKRCVGLQGINPRPPRQTFREACQLEWLDKEHLWLQMIQERSLTSHTYRHGIALEIHERIKT